MNLDGMQELQDYKSTKNIIESTNDRKELEQLESDVKSVIDRLTRPEDMFAKDYLKRVLCYLGKRIEQIIYEID